MRLAFLSVDDEFAGAMQRCVYESHPEWVVGSVISTRAIYKKNAFEAFLFVWQKSGFIYLAEMARMKLLKKLLRQEEGPRPSQLAATHSCETYWCADINHEQSLERLARWKPDLIISTNFSHYVGKNARQAARYGTWNLHKSFLPHYRGMAPSFFALLEGAHRVGATLHVVAKGFDTGSILTQVEIPVSEGDSIYSLNRKTSDEGGKMLSAYLNQLDLNDIRATPQPPGDWPNHTYPTQQEVSEFRRKRLRFG